MSKERIVCPHCGAAQREPSGVCDLCGSTLDAFEDDEVVGSESGATDSSVVREQDPDAGQSPEPQAESTETLDRGGFCTQCGTAYPVGSRFCGSCGARIKTSARVRPRPDGEPRVTTERAVPAPAPVVEPPAQKRAATDRELGRQVLLVVGAAIVLIVALFIITIVSKSPDSSSPDASSVARVESAPLAPEVQGTVQAMRAEIESLTGEPRTGKLRELADFLVSHGRWDLAGEVQAEVAEATGAEADWVRSGNLFYDWMESVDGDAKGAYAKKAVDSYQRALQINPDNLDVRTDMAIAYMFDPDNSVQAIAQTNMVLEEDSLHVQANFNRGIMLLRINRFEEAAFQFNRVKRIVDDPSNPIYQRAESALDAISQIGN